MNSFWEFVTDHPLVWGVGCFLAGWAVAACVYLHHTMHP